MVFKLWVIYLFCHRFLYIGCARARRVFSHLGIPGSENVLDCSLQHGVNVVYIVGDCPLHNKHSRVVCARVFSRLGIPGSENVLDCSL